MSSNLTNPEQVLAAIKADWDNLGACRSCGWHSAWYEVEDSIREQLENQADPVELVCGSVDGLDHRDIIISVKDLGKVAANVNTTDAQAKLNVNEAAKTRQDDANGPIPASTLPRHDDAPAPVDQPDERIRNSIASIIGVETDRYGVSEQYLIRDGDGLVLAGVDFRAELDEIVDYIARERELAAKEALKYLLDLWETRKLRGVEVDYEGDVERELAALTKGETK